MTVPPPAAQTGDVEMTAAAMTSAAAPAGSGTTEASPPGNQVAEVGLDISAGVGVGVGGVGVDVMGVDVGGGAAVAAATAAATAAAVKADGGGGEEKGAGGEIVGSKGVVVVPGLAGRVGVAVEGGSKFKVSLDGVKVVLLDIEGTTTPITFVHDTLFPYAR